jgi:hypothetical protein
MDKPSDYFEFLQNKFQSLMGLIVSEILLTVLFLNTLLQRLDLTVFFLALVITGGLLTVLWWFIRQPKKAEKNKIGFLVAIACSDTDERRRISEDFIRPLRRLISSGRMGNLFSFINAPEFLSNQIHSVDDAQSLRIRSRAQFMLFGRSRLRVVNGNSVHVIELSGIVAHQSVSKEMTENFIAEFSELLPRNLQIPIDGDYLHLEFTSEWAGIVAKYVMGIAAMFSGNLNYAENLFLEIEEELKIRDIKFPIYATLQKRIPVRLSEIAVAKARWFYQRWVEEGDDELRIASEKSINELLPTHKALYEIVNLEAILAFLNHRNCDQAIGELNKIHKRQRGQAWYLNMAFLFGYKGELSNAAKHYDRASREPGDHDALGQIEEFIERILQKEPNKIGLFYCLGLFNQRLKGDFVSAERDFSSFIFKANKAGLYQSEVALAKKWIEDLR